MPLLLADEAGGKLEGPARLLRVATRMNAVPLLAAVVAPERKKREISQGIAIYSDTKFSRHKIRAVFGQI
jgi:hypothetical protein